MKNLAQAVTLKKGFDRNHLIVMALGNIIGSGIFLASSVVISLAGPAAILAYAIGGLIMFLEVMFIAEMSIVNPAPGSFRVHVSEVFGPGMGFINGWMFWCSGVLGMASEVTASAVFSAFWFPQVPLWVFCLLYAGVMTLINLRDARGLSKIEMWLASVKVMTLVAFILFGFLTLAGIIPARMPLNTGGFQSVSAFMPGGIQGLLASLIIVLFSYTGTGIIGIAIAETNQPEKNVPPAIYRIVLSVVALYILSIFFVVLMMSPNAVSVAQSPFVEIIQNAGIAYGGSIINFIVLTASLSGLNSAMYSASRMLYSLSRDKQAPAFFMISGRNGVPVYALGASSMVLAGTAVLSYALPERVFIILTGASGFTAMFNWLTISITHYYYRKKVLREKPEKLKFKVKGYPAVSIIAALAILGILATSPLYPGQVASMAVGIVLLVTIVVIYFGLRKVRVVQ